MWVIVSINTEHDGCPNCLHDHDVGDLVVADVVTYYDRRNHPQLGVGLFCNMECWEGHSGEEE